MVGVGVTITDPGARVDSCAPGVMSPNSDSRLSGRGSGNRKRQNIARKLKGFWFHCVVD